MARSVRSLTVCQLKSEYRMRIQKIGSLLFVAFAASSAAAQTKAPEPDYTLAYNIGVTTRSSYTDYALTVNYDFGNGLVLGLKYNF